MHPRGELQNTSTGRSSRTVLFRVRYGDDMSTRTKEWPTNPEFRLKPEDAAFFKVRPNG